MEITQENSPTCNDLNQIFKEAGVPYGCKFIGSSRGDLSAFAVHTYGADFNEARHLAVHDVNKLSKAFENAGIRVVDIRDIAELQEYPSSARLAQQVNPFAIILRRRAVWQDALQVKWRGGKVLNDNVDHSKVLVVANDMNIAFSVYNLSRPYLLLRRPALLRNLRQSS